MKKLLALALVTAAAAILARRPEVKDAVVRAIDDPRFQRALATARTRAGR